MTLKKILVVLLAYCMLACTVLSVSSCDSISIPGIGTSGIGDETTETSVLSIEKVYAMAQAVGYTKGQDDFIKEFNGESVDHSDGSVGVKDAKIKDGKLHLEMTDGKDVNCGEMNFDDDYGSKKNHDIKVGDDGNWHVDDKNTNKGAHHKKGEGEESEIITVVSIEKTSSAGLVDTYTVRFSDNTSFTFEITHPRNVVKTEQVNGEIIVYYNDGTTENIGKVECDCGYCNGIDEGGVYDIIFYEGKDPTCTEIGWNAYAVCTRCGFSTYEGEIPALGHEGVWITEKEATCTEEGSRYLECQRCFMALESEITPALGHSMVDGVCENCGKHEYTVEVNYVYEDGTTAAESVVLAIWEGETYSINSPDIEDYRADIMVVSGTASESITYTVTYTSIAIEKITRIRTVVIGAVEYNTSFEELGLPETVTGITSNGREVELTAHWSTDSYSATTYGDQIVTGMASAGYGYVLACDNVISATLTVSENIIVEINEMNLGRLPLNTNYDGLGLPTTAAVTTSTGAIHYVPVTWNVYEYDSSVSGSHTIDGTLTLEEGFVFADGVANKAKINFILSETMYGTADIVFIVDSTGSMWDEIQNVRRNINRFAEKLEDEGVSVRWALLEYRDITCDGNDSTRVIYCGSSEWYIDVDAYEKALAGLDVGGGGDREETVIDALKAASYLDSRADAKTFNIVVTDADFKIENNYGVENMSEMISELVNNGTITSVVTKTRYYDVYRALTDSTGGILANIDGNFADELWRLSDLIAEEVVYGEVVSIEVVQLPMKTLYKSGDYFNGSGMIVRAHYASGLSRDVTGYSVMPCGALQLTDTQIEINYRGKTATFDIKVEETIVPVTGIETSESYVEFEEGQIVEVIATVKPNNATNQNVVWETMNPNVATVVNGKIEAIGVGETIVTVSTDDGIYTSSITVKVNKKTVAVSGLLVDVGALQLLPGSRFTPSVIIFPEEATNKEVVWSSSDDSIVTVTDGVIYAGNEGSATLTVTTADGGFSAKIYVVVKLETGNVSGRVYNTAGTLLSGVTISAYKDGAEEAAMVVESSSGSYVLSDLVYGTYRMVYELDGYMVAEQTVVIETESTQAEDIVLVLDVSDIPGYISGYAKSATTGYGIASITVNVRAGRNNLDGDILQVLTTDSNGYYVTDALAPGYYTLEFVDLRGYTGTVYGTETVNTAVEGNATTSGQNVSLVNVAGLNPDSMRIVLTWGSTPSDLDSHLLINNQTGSDYHIAYYSKEPSGANANLDVDDTSSYGPETVTIVTLSEGAEYTYYIHNYSGGGNSVLSNSSAKVQVYFGTSTEAAYEFTVPTGSGRYWKIFSYDGYTGEFTIFNTIVTSEPTI